MNEESFIIKEEPAEEFELVLPFDEGESFSVCDVAARSNVKEEPADDFIVKIISPISKGEAPLGKPPLKLSKKNKKKTNKKPKKSCLFCGRMLKTFVGHCKETSSTCPICKTIYKCKGMKDKHFKLDHGDKFECNECPYVTKILQLFNTHQSIHLKPQICNTCNNTFANSSVLRTHQMKHKHGAYSTDPQQELKCDHCGKLFSSMRYLRSHRARINEEKVKCDICGVSRFKSYIRSHMLTHVKVPCPICKKMISDFSAKVHIATHFSVLEFACDVCGKTCPTKYLMKHHIEQKHSNEIVFYGCKFCRKKFKENLALEAHIMLLHPKNPSKVQCTICKKMIFEHTMKRHVEYHSSQVVSKCAICGKEMTTKRLLQRHIKNMHSEVELIDCHLCHQKFKAKVSLRKHIRIFHPEKPHLSIQCEVCKKMIFEYRVVRHMKNHSQNEVCHCHPCRKEFASKKSLIRHMERKHS